VAFDKYLQFQGYYHADIETSASFPLFNLFFVTANAYGSNTQLHVTQNADTLANINHTDIQEHSTSASIDMMLYISW